MAEKASVTAPNSPAGAEGLVARVPHEKDYAGVQGFPGQVLFVNSSTLLCKPDCVRCGLEAWLAGLGREGLRELRVAPESIQMLKNACDRDWKDEGPDVVLCIAANGLYWRDVEIAVLKGSPDYQNGFIAGRESLCAPLTPCGERIAECLRLAVEWNDDYMRINKLYGKVAWAEWAKKLLTGNLEKLAALATPAASAPLLVDYGTNSGNKCPDGLPPDGPKCPQCGGERALSGVDGGTWVHYNPANAKVTGYSYGKKVGERSLYPTAAPVASAKGERRWEQPSDCYCDERIGVCDACKAARALAGAGEPAVAPPGYVKFSDVVSTLRQQWPWFSFSDESLAGYLGVEAVASPAPAEPQQEMSEFERKYPFGAAPVENKS